MICERHVSVRVVSKTDDSVTADLGDHDNGLWITSHQEPEVTDREDRSTSPRVPGSSLNSSVEDDGFFLALGFVDGDTWAQCQSRWEALKSGCRAERRFWLELEIEGVTKRWDAERPEVTPGAVDASAIFNGRQTYQLRFRVQPNPTVSID